MWAETPVRNDHRYKNLGIGHNMVRLLGRMGVYSHAITRRCRTG